MSAEKMILCVHVFMLTCVYVGVCVRACSYTHSYAYTQVSSIVLEHVRQWYVHSTAIQVCHFDLIDTKHNNIDKHLVWQIGQGLLKILSPLK